MLNADCKQQRGLKIFGHYIGMALIALFVTACSIDITQEQITDASNVVFEEVSSEELDILASDFELEDIVSTDGETNLRVVAVDCNWCRDPGSIFNAPSIEFNPKYWSYDSSGQKSYNKLDLQTGKTIYIKGGVPLYDSQGNLIATTVNGTSAIGYYDGQVDSGLIPGSLYKIKVNGKKRWMTYVWSVNVTQGDRASGWVAVKHLSPWRDVVKILKQTKKNKYRIWQKQHKHKNYQQYTVQETTLPSYMAEYYLNPDRDALDTVAKAKDYYTRDGRITGLLNIPETGSQRYGVAHDVLSIGAEFYVDQNVDRVKVSIYPPSNSVAVDYTLQLVWGYSLTSAGKKVFSWINARALDGYSPIEDPKESEKPTIIETDETNKDVYNSVLETYLRELAVMAEVNYIDFDTYPATVSDIEREYGLTRPENIAVTVVVAGDTRNYCFAAEHSANLGIVYSVGPQNGVQKTADCSIAPDYEMSFEVYLRELSTMAEMYYIDYNTYPLTVSVIEKEYGLTRPDSIAVTVVVEGNTRNYCFAAEHSGEPGIVYSVSPQNGVQKSADCSIASIDYNISLESYLLELSTMAEMYYIDYNTYPVTVSDIEREYGLRTPETIAVTVIVAGDTRNYCFSAEHSSEPGVVYSVGPQNGVQKTADCTVVDGT